MVQEMGMTDKQFNAFVRFVLDDIKEVLEQLNDSKENSKAKEKLEKVAENLQQTLED